MLSLFLPMFAHVLLCAFLYVLLTLARAPAVWNAGGNVPALAALAARKDRISANLSNQFEWPVFFHVICLFNLFQAEIISAAMVLLAWLFIAGRIIHSAVHIALDNVRLRGLVFTINFVAVFSMWVLQVIYLYW
ncbi:hypothetical protein FJ444_07745 [Aestuariibacter sp. GS-14]|uniref:MAPEG family protein n=1 Tax=Aestuariibacter sp. GS-14 TaxID=2590670 RepID=UPI001128212F|nr:MAPEG family protein [Aestuariibacter sp. GS-14]TPV60034.1 hypothetical protein FJ444_07745 [Aestuariibacter sp. GS-14]